jgi:hypothetical protein
VVASFRSCVRAFIIRSFLCRLSLYNYAVLYLDCEVFFFSCFANPLRAGWSVTYYHGRAVVVALVVVRCVLLLLIFELCSGR